MPLCTRPSSHPAATSSLGTAPFSSASRDAGLSTSRAKPAIVSRTSSCSSVGLKLTMGSSSGGGGRGLVPRRHEPAFELQHERVEEPAQIDLLGILVVLNLGPHDACRHHGSDGLGCVVATEDALLLPPADDPGEERAHPAQDAAEL